VSQLPGLLRLSFGNGGQRQLRVSVSDLSRLSCKDPDE
jgi:hypothetical protein